MRGFNPNWIVGRRIVHVDMGACKVPYGPSTLTMHDPTITLDNGVRLRFLTEENPHGGEYGVNIIYIPNEPRR